MALLAVCCHNTASSQTVDIIANPTTATSYVFGTNLYAANESIYTETEIGAANFTTMATAIDQVAFNINAVGTNTTFTNVTIWMKEVPLATTTFTSGTYSVSGYTQVFTGAVTAAATGWVPIPLTTPFQRTSGTNLQLLVERNDGLSHAGYIYNSAGGNNSGNTAASSRRYNGADALSATTTLATSAFRAQIRLQHVGTLPLKLLSFNGQRSGKANLITWSTSLELNTDRFIIEQSTGGRSFSSVGEVEAAGKDASVQHYSFLHNAPAAGSNYYRLRILDADNSGQYSVIIRLRSKGSFDVTSYPNPVKSILSLKVNADKTGRGELVVTDISGKVVTVKTLAIASGSNIIPVDVNKLGGGVYFIKITMDGDEMISRFNKQ